jgi:hypothetical protein
VSDVGIAVAQTTGEFLGGVNHMMLRDLIDVEEEGPLIEVQVQAED